MYTPKIIAEIRFEPSFFFDEARIKSDLHKMFAIDFEHIVYDENQKVMFFVNSNQTKKMMITKSNIILELDDPNDMSEIQSFGNSYITKVLSKLEVSKTLRIGVRAHVVMDEIEGAENTVLTIKNKFFSEELQLFTESNKTDEDFVPSVSFNVKLNGELYMTVNVGRHQVGTGVADAQGNIKSLNIEKSHPALDIDSYLNLPKEPNQVNGVLKGIVQYIREHSGKLWAMGESQYEYNSHK